MCRASTPPGNVLPGQIMHVVFMNKRPSTNILHIFGLFSPSFNLFPIIQPKIHLVQRPCLDEIIGSPIAIQYSTAESTAPPPPFLSSQASFTAGTGGWIRPGGTARSGNLILNFSFPRSLILSTRPPKRSRYQRPFTRTPAPLTHTDTLGSGAS